MKTLIDETARLSYRIELEISGQEVSAHGYASQDLAALRAHQKAWASLTWTKDYRVPMLNGLAWELFGNVLCQLHSDGQSLQFLQLPSEHRRIEERVWTVRPDITFSIRDIGIDPSQDLLVLIEPPRWYGPRYLNGLRIVPVI